MKKTAALILCLCMLMSLSSCESASAADTDAPANTAGQGENNEQSAAAPPAQGSIAALPAHTEIENISAAQGSGNVSADAEIRLGGASAEVSSDTITVSGGIITLTQPGKYVITGKLDNGTICVNADKSDKIELILNGAEINSEAGAAIYVKQADKVTVKTADGSVNKLSNGGSYAAAEESGVDAVIFSRDDLTFSGGGTLAISAAAGHGIVSKDDLKIKGGEYTVNAAGHAFSANDSIEISGGSFDMTSGKDGFNCGKDDDAQKGAVTIEDGSFRIASAGDAVAAGSTLSISGGAFDITAGGGSKNASKKSDTSAKALKAAADISLSGGTFNINSADDAIHSNASVTVSGGSFVIATGDDGFHADETLTVKNGNIDITESFEGLEGLNIDISGGEIRMVCSDDGLNAAGGNDGSGFGGMGGGDRFGKGGKFGKENFDKGNFDKGDFDKGSFDRGDFGSGGSFPGGNGDIPTPPQGGEMPSFPQGGEMPSFPQGGGQPPAMPTAAELSADSVDAQTHPTSGVQSAPDIGGQNASINISGGVIYVNADGDGIDSNGTLNISGGEIYVSGPTSSMNGAIDYENTGTITGGTVIAVGAAGMAQNFSSASQGAIYLNTGRQEAGSTVTVTDESGNVLARYTPEKTYETAVISSPALKVGGKYTVAAGSFSQTVTLETEIYGEGFGGFGSFGGFGGGFGGRR